MQDTGASPCKLFVDEREGTEQDDNQVDPDEINFEQQEEYDLDDPNVEQLPGNTGGRVTGERSRSGRSNTDEAEGVYYCSVTGLVPFREQLRLYQDALLNSKGRNPLRDVPTYINWSLERAQQNRQGDFGEFQEIARGLDVNEGGDSNRGGEGRARAFMNNDEGGDDFHPNFRNPMLTSALPSVETLDPKRAFVHDRIHLLTEQEYAKESEQVSDVPTEDENQNPGLLEQTSSSQSSPGMRGIPGRPFGEGDRSYNEGRPREGQGRRGFEGRGQATEFSGDMPLEDAPEYLMFRYVDLDVVPGRTYRYRLALVVDDPNNSRMGSPSADALEGQVAERLSDPNVREYKARLTDFSEASRPVRVLTGQNLLMGQVEPVPKSVIRDSGLVYARPGAEVTAKVVALKFDAERALDIPSEETVRPGSTVGFKKELWVPIWGQGVMVKEPQDFKFDSVVLDIRGGNKPSKDVLAQPGEMLVWDESGRVRILSETDDPDEYARNVLKPAKRRRGREGDGEAEGRRGGEGGRGEGGGGERGGSRGGGRRSGGRG